MFRAHLVAYRNVYLYQAVRAVKFIALLARRCRG